jgi:hypothetical protein
VSKKRTTKKTKKRIDEKKTVDAHDFRPLPAQNAGNTFIVPLRDAVFMPGLFAGPA